MPVRSLVDAVQSDILLEDGARPEVAGWDLSAIWTPGHSPGHLSFYEASRHLMLSGDHVLPCITPNIPFHPQAGANPLGDSYIASRLPWSRDWSDIVGFMRRAAVGETVSHLKVLQIDGVVEVADGEPAMWPLREQSAVRTLECREGRAPMRHASHRQKGQPTLAGTLAVVRRTGPPPLRWLDTRRCSPAPESQGDENRFE
jgi:Metallo-beta-lactamase superfamily